VQFGCGGLETAPKVRDHWYWCCHFSYFNMTSDVMFWDKFLTSDVSATNLMLTGFLFFPHFLSFQDEKKLDSWFLSFFHQSLTLINGVTRGLTLGGKLSWRGTTSQNSKTKLRTIVNLWMPWMSVLHKKMKTPRKTQKNNLKNTNYQNVNWRGTSFYTALARREGRPLPPVS